MQSIWEDYLPFPHTVHVNSHTLVVGASGFIGSRLSAALTAGDLPLLQLGRAPSEGRGYLIGDLDNIAALSEACRFAHTVFHCAGYAHAFASLGDQDIKRHWVINFEGTRNLLNAAVQNGVSKFVFLSSVKAQAEPGEVCSDEDFSGKPETAYGLAKRAAEEAVLEAGARFGMHVVNLRLAMVYGSGGRGNLERMGRLVKRGIFPPLPETGNHRSMVHVDDVVDAMLLVAADVRANGQTYIVASREAPSGRELFDALREAQGMPACRWAVPEAVLRLAGRVGDGVEHLTRRRMPLDSEVVMRLLDSAWYSPARIERELGWRARVSLAAGLREMLGR